MEFYRIALAAIGLLFLSCANEEKTETQSFDPEQRFELKGEKVFENEFSWQIESAGEYLLFEQNTETKENDLYHVYRAANLEFLGSVGERGQVPYGFIGAQYCGQYYVENGNTIFWVNDAPKRRISAINIEGSLDSDFAVIDRFIEHKPWHDFMNALYVLNEDGLAGHQPGFIKGSNQQPLYILKNKESKELISAGKYPEVRNIKDFAQGERIAGNFNRLSMAMKPDMSRFVIAFKLYDRLDVFDDDGKLVTSVRHPEKYEEYNAFNVLDMSLKAPIVNVTTYYQKVVVTDDLIFALCLDRKKGVELEDNPSVQIRVFDWFGKLKYLLNCPNDLVTIAVDMANKKLYGHDALTQSFLQFDISMLDE